MRAAPISAVPAGCDRVRSAPLHHFFTTPKFVPDGSRLGLLCFPVHLYRIAMRTLSPCLPLSLSARLRRQLIVSYRVDAVGDVHRCGIPRLALGLCRAGQRRVSGRGKLVGAPPALHNASCDGVIDHRFPPGNPSRDQFGGTWAALISRCGPAPVSAPRDGANAAYDALLDVDVRRRQGPGGHRRGHRRGRLGRGRGGRRRTSARPVRGKRGGGPLFLSDAPAAHFSRSLSPPYRLEPC